jgi:hypothetical protein
MIHYIKKKLLLKKKRAKVVKNERKVSDCSQHHLDTQMKNKRWYN